MSTATDKAIPTLNDLNIKVVKYGSREFTTIHKVLVEPLVHFGIKKTYKNGTSFYTTVVINTDANLLGHVVYMNENNESLDIAINTNRLWIKQHMYCTKLALDCKEYIPEIAYSGDYSFVETAFATNSTIHKGIFFVYLGIDTDILIFRDWSWFEKTYLNS